MIRPESMLQQDNPEDGDTNSWFDDLYERILNIRKQRFAVTPCDLKVNSPVIDKYDDRIMFWLNEKGDGFIFNDFDKTIPLTSYVTHNYEQNSPEYRLYLEKGYVFSDSTFECGEYND